MFDAEHRRLSGLDPLGLSRPELLQMIRELHQLEKRAQERRLAFTAAIEQLDDGGADAAAVTRTITHASARSAKQTAAAASALRQMPDTAGALARGEIDTEHVAAVTAAAEATSHEEADQLVGKATAQPADLFAKNTRRWTNRRMSNDQLEARRQRQLANREAVWWKTDDGMTHLHGVFDAESGRRVIAALDRRVDRLWRSDGGRDGTPDEIRTPAQRRLDALVAMVAPEATAESGPTPTSATTQPATPTKDGSWHPKHMVIVHLDARTGEAEFTDGEPVPRSLLLELGPAAEVIGIVYGTDGQPLHLGRSVRLASRAQWVALIDRDRGCVHSGAEPSRCEAHHHDDFGSGGPTNIDNLELVSHRDHSLLHQHGFDPRRRPKQPRAA